MHQVDSWIPRYIVSMRILVFGVGIPAVVGVGILVVGVGTLAVLESFRGGEVVEGCNRTIQTPTRYLLYAREVHFLQIPYHTLFASLCLGIPERREVLGHRSHDDALRCLKPILSLVEPNVFVADGARRHNLHPVLDQAPGTLG